MKSYLETKLLLFKNILKKNKVLISDKTIKEFSILKKISEKKNLKLIEISKIEKKLKNSDFVLNQFQIKNLSMAIVAAKLCKIKEKKIFNSIYKIKDVNGRLELVKIFHNNVRVFVDFAHTPDALLKTLQVLKNDYNENISLVFGCGGDRDFKKRPLMAKIASSNCKKIFVTDDNPRNEKPEKIRDEIIRNIKNKNCFNIGDRSKAIKIAIDNAEPNEIILVAGKGHETEQIYKTKIISSSDRKIIKNLKFKKNKISKKNQSFEENKKVLKSIHRNIKVKDFHGLAIDSREVKKNNLFLTIKGKKK